MRLALKKDQATEAVELLAFFGIGFIAALFLLTVYALIMF
jgi:hypothetical protein